MKMGARRNHYYYIDRYPKGLDATVFRSDGGSTQTMSFTNDTGSPVLIRGINTRSGNNGWVTFVIYSVPNGRKVVIGPAVVKNSRKATDTTVLHQEPPEGDPQARGVPGQRHGCLADGDGLRGRQGPPSQDLLLALRDDHRDRAGRDGRHHAHARSHAHAHHDALSPDLFVRGLAIGFAVAFALGPIGLLVIRRTIDRGWSYGFLSGAGVATADAAYAAIAAFGLTAVTEVLVGIRQPLSIAGGAALLIMAARSLRSALGGPVVEARREVHPADTPAMAFGSMVGLTLTNPATILSFAALFASIGAGTGGTAGAALVVAGVFAGSVAWWAILTGAVAGLRARLTPGVVRGFNVVSSLAIGAFGIIAIGLGLAG